MKKRSETRRSSGRRSSSAARRLLRVAQWLLLMLCFLLPAAAQELPRVAIVDLAGEGQAETALLRELAAGDVALVDEGQMRAALRGTAYTGSLNLSRAEARALGMSIGCDYYLLGVVQVLRRAATAGESWYDGIAGIFTVETRSGRLLLFDFCRTKAADEQLARAQLAGLLRQSWRKSAATIAESVSRSESELTLQPQAEMPVIVDNDTPTVALTQPVFYQRLKPPYTEEAGSLSVTATVELEAIFREDGQVGEVEVVRWAGFGLDEAALATVRQLRFKPAERDGRAVSLRALVRYNFRHPPTEAEKKAEAERLRRSLREAQQQRRPQG